MSLKNYYETMDNCREYLRSNPNVKEAFENLETSNCTGFEYSVKGYAVKIRVDKTIDFLIMEVYPGITARGTHLSMVAEYCQRVSACPGEGYLAVDRDQRNVYYHTESCFLDNPISGLLLKKMESKAIEVLEQHVPNIVCLAYGRLPEWNGAFPVMDDVESDVQAVNEADLNFLRLNAAEIRTHLTDSGHNVVGENLNPDSPIRFYLETLSKDMRYREFIHIRHDGWLFRTLCLDVKTEAPFRNQLAQYCNESSDEKKVGFLKINESGIPCCTVATYLLGEHLISSQTLEKMGRIAATFLKASEPKLMYIGHGVLPPEDGDDTMHEIAKTVLGDIPRRRGKSGAGHDNSPSLLELLASLDDDGEDEDDDIEFDVDELLKMLSEGEDGDKDLAM